VAFLKVQRNGTSERASERAMEPGRWEMGDGGQSFLVWFKGGS
jgi:hypothetical protein